MRPPLYFLSTLLYFWLPSAFLAWRLWPGLPRARREAFWAALGVIWPMSVAMEYVYLHFRIWTFSEAVDPLLGPRILGAPIEEFCFWLGAPVFIILVYSALRLRPRAPTTARALEAGAAASGLFSELADAELGTVPTFATAAAFPLWGPLFLPFLVAFWWLYHAFHRRVRWSAAWLTVAVFELVVFPAEAFSVHRGHWVYNDARIFGWRLLGVPLEEPLLYYLFSPLIIVTVFEAFRAGLEGRRAARVRRMAEDAAAKGLVAEEVAAEAATGLTPFYLFSILLFFLVPVLELLKVLWPRLPKRPFLAAFCVIAVLGWSWSWLVSASGWWTFGPRYMLGFEVLPHLPLEEVLFYPLGGALSVLLYLLAYDPARPPRPRLFWSYLLAGTAVFAGLAAWRWELRPFYIVSQMVVYNGLCGLALAPWTGAVIDLTALTLPVALLSVLGFVWNYIGFKYGWWAYHATLGLNVSVEPIDDFNFFLYAPPAAVSVYHAACRLAGSEPLRRR